MIGVRPEVEMTHLARDPFESKANRVLSFVLVLLHPSRLLGQELPKGKISLA